MKISAISSADNCRAMDLLIHTEIYGEHRNDCQFLFMIFRLQKARRRETVTIQYWFLCAHCLWSSDCRRHETDCHHTVLVSVCPLFMIFRLQKAWNWLSPYSIGFCVPTVYDLQIAEGMKLTVTIQYWFLCACCLWSSDCRRHETDSHHTVLVSVCLLFMIFRLQKAWNWQSPYSIGFCMPIVCIYICSISDIVHSSIKE